MNTSRLWCAFVPLFLFPLMTNGFEPMKGSVSRGPSKLKAAPDNNHDGDDSVVIEAYRSKLQNTYTYNPHQIEDDDRFAFMREMADELAAETFADSVGLDMKEPCGVDCEECMIPEGWKDLPGSAEEVNVMDFLGIRRAEPLRKGSDWD